MTMTKQSNSFTNNYLSNGINVKKEIIARAKCLSKLDLISAALGLTGSYYLSAGNSLLAQGFFCLANPILALVAWKNKSYPLILLYTAYEYYAAVGVLRLQGMI
jgi:hypothetical protein